MKTSEISIIGAGPAGIAAAIQLKRCGIKPLIFERAEIGGFLRNANLVENYPGFPNGISGQKLAGLLKAHLEKSDLEVIRDEVVRIDRENSLFQIRTKNDQYSCRILVIASGTEPEVLKTVDIESLTGSKVFYDIIEIMSVKSRIINIIGAGDAAFDYALNLARYNQVIINNRSAGVSCLPLLRDRASWKKSIIYRENCKLIDIKDHSNGLTLEWQQNGAKLEENSDYLVIAIGRKPNLSFLSESILHQLEELQTEGNLYMIGDVKNGLFRQAAISVGDGIMAAMKIYRKSLELNK